MAEPTPIRDNGPYDSERAALAQVEAVLFGLPATAADAHGPRMVLLEALMASGVELSPYEQRATAELALLTTPGLVQVVAGWIVRAHIAGRA